MNISAHHDQFVLDARFRWHDTIRWFVLLVALLLLPLSANAQEGMEFTMPEGTMSIATGSPSGLYYPFGGGLAQIWSKTYPEINIKAEVTGGSAVNIIQVAKGESELGISQGDALRDAIAGKGIFPYPMPVRALFALYPNVVHGMTRADSDIQSYSDLRGKKVSIGAPGSGTAITTLNILKTLGIGEDDISIQYLSYTETAEALKTGTIDAGFMVGGLGLAAAVELALTSDVRLIPVRDDEMAQISLAFPAYTAFDIPAETYKGMDRPMQTVTLWNFLIVHRDMPEELAGKLTLTAFDNAKDMLQVTKSARFMTVENSLKYAENILHPAAESYLMQQSLLKPFEPLGNQPVETDVLKQGDGHAVPGKDDITRHSGEGRNPL